MPNFLAFDKFLLNLLCTTIDEIAVQSKNRFNGLHNNYYVLYH